MHETPGIYSRCIGVNGHRGMIYDPGKTDPLNWEYDKGPRLSSPVEAIIYEIHTRDFSISPDSGVLNKGKFLAFTEKNTQTKEGIKTGLSHIKELGVTHVHLLPVNDFATVDEEKPDIKYNWGYDPMHFNALEGSYSSNPYDGRFRINEFKQLVQSLHNEGLGVILNIVYNHTYYSKESVFNQTIPRYFYRQKPDRKFANASDYGNEIATERAMVRKYIIDSLKFWIEEYHIDGFRFDLMGIYDIETMRIIRSELNNFHPGIILYGEGWAADVSPMPEMYRAVKINIAQLPGIAVYNDDFRDALKGNLSTKKSNGFVNGLVLREEAVKFGIVGAVWHPQITYNYVETSNSPWAVSPDQCINYVSCHDNYTLWDKLIFSLPKATDKELRKSVKLAAALILTSQGIPFLDAGVEFCRTKGGNGNSYKSPDSVNQIDWSRKSVYIDVYEYIKKLVLLRKNHPAFRMPLAKDIAENISFCHQYRIGVVSYCLNGEKAGDSWGKIVVIFNGNNEEVNVSIPLGKYQIMANGNEISETVLELRDCDELKVESVSMTILVAIP